MDNFNDGTDTEGSLAKGKPHEITIKLKPKKIASSNMTGKNQPITEPTQKWRFSC